MSNGSLFTCYEFPLVFTGIEYNSFFFQANTALERKTTKWLPEVYYSRDGTNAVHATIMGTFDKCSTSQSQRFTRFLRRHSVHYAPSYQETSSTE